MISFDDLKKIMSYDPESGNLLWLISRGKARIGSIAGCIYSDGYRVVTILGKRYRSTHLAFLLMTGNMPENIIDHIDLMKSNDRWKNLREANRSQNGANQKLQSRSKTRLKGVHKKRKRSWDSAIRHDGKTIYLGSFLCPAAAHFAYVVAAHKLHGEFARFS
jgi:hypothetical protein